MTRILAFSGKKGSGKTSAVNSLFGLAMLNIQPDEHGPLIDYFKLSQDGRLIVPADKEPREIYDAKSGQWVESTDGRSEGYFDPVSRDPAVVAFLSNWVWPHIKIYNFADVLKQICILVLGLDENLVYGSEQDKNQLTNVRWENAHKLIGRRKQKTDNFSEFMTVREVLQFVGTKMFRRLYPGCWCESTIRRILAESPQYALIGDCRFEDEVRVVQEAGGKVIRFTRSIEDDQDESEVALDGKEDLFDAVIDNTNMDMQEKNHCVQEYLREWGWFEATSDSHAEIAS